MVWWTNIATSSLGQFMKLKIPRKVGYRSVLTHRSINWLLVSLRTGSFWTRSVWFGGFLPAPFLGCSCVFMFMHLLRVTSCFFLTSLEMSDNLWSASFFVYKYPFHLLPWKFYFLCYQGCNHPGTGGAPKVLWSQGFCDLCVPVLKGHILFSSWSSCNVLIL